MALTQREYINTIKSITYNTLILLIILYLSDFIGFLCESYAADQAGQAFGRNMTAGVRIVEVVTE